MSAAIAGLGWAVPTPVGQGEAWERFFAGYYAGVRAAERIWRQVGVERRHGAVVPFKEDVRDWGTEARMRRFVEEALPLGCEAVTRCLASAGLDPAAVELLTVATCTGYATPGLDVLVARELGLRPSLERLHVGHMGCYAALPALAATSDAAAARGRTGVLLCVELPSLHLQPASRRIDQVVSSALFADAAAAAAVVPGGGGLRVAAVTARTDPATAGMMTWDVTERGFRMGLDPGVPAVLAARVEPVVGELLAARGLDRRQVAAWAVHPGGPRVLDVVAERLGLAEEALGPSRAVLREYGNCSSATILMVIDRVLRERDLRPGAAVVALAFGPGLTLYGALLERA